MQLLYPKLKRKLKGDVITAHFPTTFCSSGAQISLEVAQVFLISAKPNKMNLHPKWGISKPPGGSGWVQHSFTAGRGREGAQSCCPRVPDLGMGTAVTPAAALGGILQELSPAPASAGTNSWTPSQPQLCCRKLQMSWDYSFYCRDCDFLRQSKCFFSVWGVCFDVCCFYFRRVFDHILLWHPCRNIWSAPAPWECFEKPTLNDHSASCFYKDSNLDGFVSHRTISAR